jgi:S1-C subfamily serine protease
MILTTFRKLKQQSFRILLGTTFVVLCCGILLVDGKVDDLRSLPRAPATTTVLNTAVQSQSVLVQTDRGSGSGIVLKHGDGGTLILTCAHTLIDAQRYAVMHRVYHPETGAPAAMLGVDAELVRVDYEKDLALLLTAMPLENRNPVMFSGYPVLVGDPIYTIGAPYGLVGAFAHGFVSHTESPTNFYVDMPIGPGNSGGAIYNRHGEVIGLAQGVLSFDLYSQLGIVIRTSVIAEFLTAEE